MIKPMRRWRKSPEPIDNRDLFVGSLTLAAIGAMVDGEERRKILRTIESREEANQ